MGLSRRQFTQEFKRAAIQRLEMGASVAEVWSGRLKPTPMCSIAGGGRFVRARAMHFLARGSALGGGPGRATGA